MSTSFPSLSPLSAAIAQAEGYGTQGAIPTVANNPGSLELGNVGSGTMTAQGGQQITIFPTAQAGATALENQVQSAINGTSNVYNPNMTLSQFGSIYSGGNATYGNTLASTLGVSPATPLSQVTSAASPSLWQSVQQGFSMANQLDPFSMASKTAGISSLIYSPRLIVLLVGIILIAAGLFTFKTTQTILTTAAKRVGEVAAA